MSLRPLRSDAASARNGVPCGPASSAREVVELKRRAAEQLLQSGHIDAGIAVVRDVLPRVGLRLAASPRRALLSLLLSVPAGGTTLSGALPNDPALWFFDLDLQALEVDSFASKGVSFTAGLQLHCGFDLP